MSGCRGSSAAAPRRACRPRAHGRRAARVPAPARGRRRRRSRWRGRVHGLDADAPEEAVARRAEPRRCATRRTRRSRGTRARGPAGAGGGAASWFTPDGAAPPASSRQRNTCVGAAENTTSRSPVATRAIAASRSAGSMNGDVAWMNTVTASPTPRSRRRGRPRAAAASAMRVQQRRLARRRRSRRSPRAAPRSRRPRLRAASAIASSSVVTTTRPIRSAASAARTARATSGTPPDAREVLARQALRPAARGDDRRRDGGRGIRPACDWSTWRARHARRTCRSRRFGELDLGHGAKLRAPRGRPVHAR